MEFFNNGSRGWERDTCPIVDKIVLPATKFRNFCATHLHTLQSCAFACLHIGQKITVCKNMFYHVYKFSLKHVLAQMYLYIETLELPCFMFAHEHTYKLAHCAPCILLEAKAPEWTNGHKQIPHLPTLVWQLRSWTQGFKIVTSSPASANWREAVWLNTENKAFNDAIHTSYFPPPIHTRTQQRGKLLTVFPPNFARTGRFQKLFKAQL